MGYFLGVVYGFLTDYQVYLTVLQRFYFDSSSVVSVYGLKV